MTHQFDSQTFVRRMEAAGMARQIAEELADALGSVVLDGLVRRRDLEEWGTRLEGQTRETELRLRQDMREQELRITLRLGSMLAASTALTVAVLGALIAFAR